MTILDTMPTLLAPLSVAMREGSMAEHEAAEHSSFMSELLEGQLNEAGYTAYLLRLRSVYDALESVGREHQHDPMVAAVYDTALERLSAIDADLDHWAPSGPRTIDSPAAQAYHQRILDSASWGGLFVAHHYTRYLGDLSGGQAIGRILDRAFGLGGAGISFYDFAEIPKPKPYKDAYRARLDSLAPDAEAQARIVAEVTVAFRMNQAIFAELGDQLDTFRR